MCIAVAFFFRLRRHKFQINLIFLIKPFFYITKKSNKNLNILRMKRVFKMK